MSGIAGGGMDAMKAGIGMMSGMMQGSRNMLLSRADLLSAAATELEAAGMGPTELAQLVQIVEWRFLQNEAALPTALSASERSDWAQQQVALGFSQSILDGAGSQMSASDRAQFERGVEQGPSRAWHPDGTLAFEGAYVDGALDGRCSFWGPDGALDEAASGTYRAGERVE